MSLASLVAHRRAAAWRYGAAVVFSVTGLTIAWMLEPAVGRGFYGAPLLAAVAASVWVGGVGPALAAAAITTVGGPLVLVEPVWFWGFPRGQDFVRWLVFLAVALLITALGRALIETRERIEQERDAAEAGRRHVEKLQGLTSELSRSSSAGEVAAAFLAHAVPALGMNGGVLLRTNPAETHLEMVEAAGLIDQAREHFERVPVEAPMAMCEAVRRRKPVWARDRDEWERTFPLSAAWFPASAQAVFAFPLLAESRAIGAVELTAAEPRTLNRQDLAFIAAVADVCAQAVARAALIEVERRARRRAEFLGQVVDRLERREGVRDRAEELLQLLVPRVADFGSVEVLESPEPVVAVAHVRSDQTPVVRAFRERFQRAEAEAGWRRWPHQDEDVVIASFTPGQEASYCRDHEARVQLRRLAPRSLVSVSMHAGPALSGVLVLGIADPARRPYDHADLDFLREVAGRCAPLLANARLAEQQRETIDQLQEAMLPARIDVPAGVSVCARYRAAHQRLDVGGDWYDAFPLPGGKVGLCVGDVVGHSVRAAATMGQLRSALTALAPVMDGPVALLDRLDAVARMVDGAYGTTLCYAEVDPAQNTVRYACAGHPPPIIIEGEGTVAFLDDGRSQPLGIVGTPRRREGHAAIRHGATLMLYSDGLFEQRGEPGDDGLERLRRVVQGHCGQGLEAFCDAVLVDMFVDAERGDDVAVLAARLD